MFSEGSERMNWLRALQTAWLLTRQENSQDADGLRACRRQFALRFDEVLSVCARISDAPAELAAAYSSHLLRTQEDAEWWRANQRYLCEEWFILRCLREQGLLKPPEPPAPPPFPLRLLVPEGTRRGTARLTLERTTERPEWGTLIVSGVEDEEIAAQLVRLRFIQQPRRLVRAVDECSAPLLERAVETGAALLSCGCAVCVDEDELARRIGEGVFLPEHLHWIDLDERVDTLRLTYPWDRTLHMYLCQAGCRWNGRYTELPLIRLERAADVLRLYGFRATQAAQMRMDAWSEASRQATIFRARRKKRQAAPRAQDLFTQMLNRPSEVLEDLRDDG